MNIIIKGLGVQSQNDLSFLCNDTSVQYIRRMEQKHAKVNGGKETFYAAACARLKLSSNATTRDLVPMLRSLLQLNPYFRPTAQECLMDKVFDQCRDPSKEQILSQMLFRRQQSSAPKQSCESGERAF